MAGRPRDRERRPLEACQGGAIRKRPLAKGTCSSIKSITSLDWCLAYSVVAVSASALDLEAIVIDVGVL